MMRSLKEFFGYSLRATDGSIGKVADFYFDDASWKIRYLVADTGKWLPGRQVLISPAAFRTPDWERGAFPISLTREQVENSPGIETNKPVSRQQEIALAEYYDWPPYWMASGPTIPAYGMAGVHVKPPAGTEPMESKAATAEKIDSHLRGARDVLEYRILATDGEIGHVEDFIINDSDWSIRHLVVDTRRWLPGRKVLMATLWIKEVRWSDAHVKVDLPRESIRRSPEYDPYEPVNEVYEKRLFDYYGRPRH